MKNVVETVKARRAALEKNVVRANYVGANGAKTNVFVAFKYWQWIENIMLELMRTLSVSRYAVLLEHLFLEHKLLVHIF